MKFCKYLYQREVFKSADVDCILMLVLRQNFS